MLNCSPPETVCGAIELKLPEAPRKYNARLGRGVEALTRTTVIREVASSIVTLRIIGSVHWASDDRTASQMQAAVKSNACRGATQQRACNGIFTLNRIQQRFSNGQCHATTRLDSGPNATATTRPNQVAATLRMRDATCSQGR